MATHFKLCFKVTFPSLILSIHLRTFPQLYTTQLLTIFFFYFHSIIRSLFLSLATLFCFVRCDFRNKIRQLMIYHARLMITRRNSHTRATVVSREVRFDSRQLMIASWVFFLFALTHCWASVCARLNLLIARKNIYIAINYVHLHAGAAVAFGC